MLVPAAIGLIIATIFVNLTLFINGVWPVWFSQYAKNLPGRVLGAAESLPGRDEINQTVVKVMAENGPLKQLWRLPENKPKTPAAELNFDLPAANGAVLDCQDDKLVFAKRADRSWPIASITKLVTAYVFLDYNPGWETGYEIKAADKREGGKIYLFSGDRVKIKDLFYFSLVGSDNTATAALVNSTGLSEGEFVKKMNEKMQALGFKNTRLVDPVGLKDGNISTARELAEFAKIALADPEISRASLTEKYEFTTEQGRKKSINSTNQLLTSYPEGGVSIMGGKTGFVNAAGYCLVSQFKDFSGRSIITVVLGAADENSRFDLTKKLVNLYYDSQP